MLRKSFLEYARASLEVTWTPGVPVPHATSSSSSLAPAVAAGGLGLSLFALAASPAVVLPRRRLADSRPR
ncbi:MAG: hypothetical protein ABR532_09710 [Candidatus Dormibacteria bacterium]